MSLYQSAAGPVELIHIMSGPGVVGTAGEGAARVVAPRPLLKLFQFQR